MSGLAGRFGLRRGGGLSVLVLLAAVAPARAEPPATAVFGAPRIGLPQPMTTVHPQTRLPGPTDAPDNAAPAGGNVDLAFGAYQRGFYATALHEAMKRLGANPKDGPALTLIGELYSEGLGVRQSREEADRWFKLGSDAGDAQASFELGMAYMKGDGVEQDRAAAHEYFAKAADKNQAGALFYLGLMAMQGSGDGPDFATAAIYFRRAADLNNAEAQYALGLMYRNGNGVPQDEEKAAPLIKAAADNDNAAAMVEYGIMLFNGIGVEKDEAAAARLFIKAAGRNNPVAQDRAARLYVSGRGVPKDVVEGMKWHLLSRAAGLKDEWLDSEMNKLTPAQREAVEKAVRHFIGS